MFTICQDYVFRTSVDLKKENVFVLKMARSRRYPAEITTEVNYADDLVLFANTPAHAKSLLHSLEQAAGGIGLYVNANKWCETFTYLGRNILFTESDVYVRLENAWTAIGKLLTIWKSGLSEKIKRDFYKLWPCQYYCKEVTIRR